MSSRSLFPTETEFQVERITRGQSCPHSDCSPGDFSGDSLEKLNGCDHGDTEGLAEGKKIAIRGDDVFSLSGQRAGKERIVRRVTTARLAQRRRNAVERLEMNPVQEWQRRTIREAGSL